jgi:hypothetical protein
VNLLQYEVEGTYTVVVLYYPNDGDTSVIRAVIIDQGSNQWTWAGDFGVNS